MKGVPGRDELAPQIPVARGAMVSMLSSLSDADWETETLCEGWTARDVVGHVLHQHDVYRVPYVRWSLIRSGFRVNRFLNREARRWAKGRSPAELLALLEDAKFEDTVTWRHHPSPVFVLTEYVVHTQDIRRPLGITDQPDPSHLLIAASVFARPKRGNPMRTALPPTHFVAIDVDWSHGEGPTVRGPLEAIVMVLAGRGQALRDLSGDGVAPLEGALS